MMIGDYEIEAMIGEGGMAKVYRARHALLDTHHAIKVLDPAYRANPGARQRFLDEAKLQAKHLDHPNIVKVTNIVATAEHAALVMELVDGPSLEQHLAGMRARPDEIKRIMLAILDAVGHAHQAGVIHRDLKPANVLLAGRGPEPVPKVTDFGIAKVTGELAAHGKKSTHGDARMGTLNYMSPEQIRRAKDVTPCSDVFSLGAMLYEMATGAVAFGGDSDYDVMENIVNGRYEPPERHFAAIDPALAAVIRQALEPDPARRFGNCEAMARALRQPASTVAPIASAPATPRAPTASTPIAAARRGRGRGLAIALLLAGLGLGGVALYLATQGRGAAPPATAARDAGGVLGDAGASTVAGGALDAGATGGTIADLAADAAPGAGVADAGVANPRLAALLLPADAGADAGVDAGAAVATVVAGPCDGTWRGTVGALTYKVTVPGSKGACGKFSFVNPGHPKGEVTCVGSLRGCKTSGAGLRGQYSCHAALTGRKTTGAFKMSCRGRKATFTDIDDEMTKPVDVPMSRR